MTIGKQYGTMSCSKSIVGREEPLFKIPVIVEKLKFLKRETEVLPKMTLYPMQTIRLLSSTFVQIGQF
jgi:hypothetical protein